MTSGIDLWRAVDPEARLLSGSVDRLRAAVRGIARSRRHLICLTTPTASC